MVAPSVSVARPAPGAETEALIDAVHAVMSAVIHRKQDALEKEGISMGQFWALHYVSSLGSASLSTVARHLAVSAPTVCVQVDELERAGLLTRHRSERDRRAVELSLTLKGRRVEARVWARLGELVGEASRTLPRGDVATATRVFREIARRLDGSGVSL
ncbi:MAG: MarR family winged helix-turn-helix transcriptional regulator [Thermoplasmata archaeon]